jgi:hypothetical protein
VVPYRAATHVSLFVRMHHHGRWQQASQPWRCSQRDPASG